MSNKHEGRLMTEEEIKEWQQVFIDILESIELVMKYGEKCE